VLEKVSGILAVPLLVPVMDTVLVRDVEADRVGVFDAGPLTVEEPLAVPDNVLVIVPVPVILAVWVVVRVEVGLPLFVRVVLNEGVNVFVAMDVWLAVSVAAEVGVSDVEPVCVPVWVGVVVVLRVDNAVERAVAVFVERDEDVPVIDPVCVKVSEAVLVGVLV